jgi:hypothetical protein
MDEIRLIIETLRGEAIPHRRFENTYSRFSSGVAFSDEATAVALVGPTRVGKTTLVRRLVTDLDKHGESYVLIEAVTTDGGFMSTKFLTEQCLVKMDHPFHLDDSPRGRGAGESRLNFRLQKALVAKHVRYLIVDEAHHLVRTKSDRSSTAAIDTLKCIGNQTKVVLVLVGGYEMLNALHSSAHFSGRLQTIDFPSYGTSAEDVEDFSRILATVDQRLPWASGQSLQSSYEFIYLGSCGCYGLLLQWTKAALSEMWSSGSKRLQLSHYKRTSLPAQISSITKEILAGRRFLDEDSCSPPNESDIGKGRHGQAGRKGRAFQRNPKRDFVARPKSEQ